jgi:hypothetical protein
MREQLSDQFTGELRSFFILSLLNVVFGAQALAFGIQFIVTAMLALMEEGAAMLIPGIQALAGGVLVVLGLRWILSSVHILSGVTKLRRARRNIEDSAPDEILTRLIIRMMAHYRENRETIRVMTLICILGGLLFLALGTVNLIQAFAEGTGSGSTSLIAAGINLTIGTVSILSSFGFRTYAAAWDLRLAEASRSEAALQNVLEQG